MANQATDGQIEAIREWFKQRGYALRVEPGGDQGWVAYVAQEGRNLNDLSGRGKTPLRAAKDARHKLVHEFDSRTAWTITFIGVAMLGGALLGHYLYSRADILWLIIALFGGFAIPQAHLTRRRRRR